MANTLLDLKDRLRNFFTQKAAQVASNPTVNRFANAASAPIPQRFQAPARSIVNLANRMAYPMTKATEGFAEASTYGLYDYKAPQSRNLLDRAAYGAGFGVGLVNPLNPVNKLAGLYKGTQLVKPLQKPLGSLAGRYIAQGGAKKLLGTGIANVSQGIPYSLAYATGKTLTGQKYTGKDAATDVGVDLALGSIPLVGGLAIGAKATRFRNMPKFEGLDKKLRAEISDLVARIKPTKLKDVMVNRGGFARLGEVFEHASLYKNYPELKNLKIEFGPTGTALGSFDPKTFSIKVSSGLSPEKMRSTLLHEIQHTIQEIEGFARGSNTKILDNSKLSPELIRVQDAISKWTRERGANSPEVTRLLKVRDQLLEMDKNRQYLSQAGEIESRAVERRANLTAAQRKQLPFYEAEMQAGGIKPEDVITRFGADSSYKSANPPLYDTKLFSKTEDIRAFKKNILTPANLQRNLDELAKDGIKTDENGLVTLYRGQSRKANDQFRAFSYFSTNPELAKRFGGTIHTVKVNPQDLVITNRMGEGITFQNPVNLVRAGNKYIIEPIKVKINPGNVAQGGLSDVPANQRSLLEEATKRGYKDKNPNANIWDVKQELSDEMMKAKDTMSQISNKYVQLKINTKNATQSAEELMTPADRKLYQEASKKFDETSDLLKTESGGLSDLQKKGIVSGFAGTPQKTAPKLQTTGQSKTFKVIDAKNTDFNFKNVAQQTVGDDIMESVAYKRGDIANIEKKINELIGYEDMGLYHGTEDKIRQDLIDYTKQEAPEDVIKKLTELENLLDETRAAKELIDTQKNSVQMDKLSAIDLKKKMAEVEKIENEFRSNFNKKLDNLELGSRFDFIKDELGRKIGVSYQGDSKKISLNAEKAREMRAKKDFNEWQKAFNKQEQTMTSGQLLDRVQKTVKLSTKSPSGRSVEGLKDISGMASRFKDVYRNFKSVYGKNYETVKRAVLDPFDKSKGNMVREQEKWLDELTNNVVNLGIKKGSRESAAVQQFGEGLRDYTSLVKEFGETSANKIVQADKWFRSAYDQLLDDVNRTRQMIYPNNPDKIIPKRKDYYRHFKEMTEGVRGILNIFDTPANISPELAGISYQTKPRSKWLSFAQKRLGNETTEDAVGGFLDYLKAATYAKHIDPHTARFRALADELASSMAERGTTFDDGKVAGRPGDLNNFINYLNRFADDLSGKTNPFDRELQETFGRKPFAVLNWINSRVKANVILGNASSAIAQAFNLPQGMASAGYKNWYSGFKNMLLDNSSTKSDFLKERYFKGYSKFDTGVLNNAKKFAVWMTQSLDEVATKLTWNMHYQKAIGEGIQNPVKYADDITRSLVAGRGIGEVPLIQKSKIFQLVAPFQLEVSNAWFVMKDMVGEKKFGALITMFVLSRLMNEGAKRLRGSDVVFDPINAIQQGVDAFSEEEDKKIGGLRLGGRIAGEILSNVPGGQTVAGMYPEYGVKIGGESVTRKELFGEGDPTRFGSGLLAARGIQDPIFKLIPSFGGQQMRRTLEGLDAYNKKASQTQSGRVRFPIANTPTNLVKSAVFGEYSTPEAQQYFGQNRTPLGEKQSQEFFNTGNKQEFYENIMNKRSMNKGKDETSISSIGQVSAAGLPTNEVDLETLYKDAQNKISGYKDLSSKIRTGLKTDMTLTEAQQELTDAKTLIAQIESENPEAALKIQINTFSSEGSETVEDRAKWAYDRLSGAKDETEFNSLYQKMLDGGVITKSVLKELNEKGLNASKYLEGGKIKIAGAGGSKPKAIKIKVTKVKIPSITVSRGKRIKIYRPKSPKAISLKKARKIKIGGVKNARIVIGNKSV